jgi:hypothetical protein
MHQEKLGPDIYGLDHPLIGVPCLYNNLPAIPYGSQEIEYAPGISRRRLVVHHIYGGKVVATSGIQPEELTPIDRLTPQGRKIFHEIMAGLANQNK